MNFPPKKGFYTQLNYKTNQTNLENNTIKDPEKAGKNHLRNIHYFGTINAYAFPY